MEVAVSKPAPAARGVARIALPLIPLLTVTGDLLSYSDAPKRRRTVQGALTESFAPAARSRSANLRCPFRGFAVLGRRDLGLPQVGQRPPRSQRQAGGDVPSVRGDHARLVNRHTEAVCWAPPSSSRKATSPVSEWSSYGSSSSVRYFGVRAFDLAMKAARTSPSST